MGPVDICNDFPLIFKAGILIPWFLLLCEFPEDTTSIYRRKALSHLLQEIPVWQQGNTRSKLPWWSLWTSMDSTLTGPANCASHKSSDPIKGPRAPVLNKTHKHLHSHTQTQLECQINPDRCHLSEYNEQYQSKALKPAGIAFTHWETVSVSRSFQLLTATTRLQAPQGQVQKMIINTQHLVYPTIKHLSGLLNWMMGDDALHSWKEIGLTDGTIQSTGYWA